MNNINLLPLPKKIDWLDGICLLTLKLPESINVNSENFDGIEARLNTELDSQAFCLSVTKSIISLEYGCKLGRFYGLNLLLQISKQTDKIPCLRIEDAPDYENRGIILDISRDKVPKLSHLFSMIDLWSSLRINQLQLYTEHTFAYSQHPKVWANSSAYYGEEIKQIDQYCLKKGIELVVNQATFGHMERWLQHEDYRYLAEQTTGFIDQRGDFRPFSFGLNPLGEQSADFVSGLLDELLPHFSSNKININFDETMDLGVDASKEACEALGKGEVYVGYLNKLLSFTQKKELHTQIFSDMLFHYPEILNKLPNNLTLLNWGYEAEHPFDKEHQLLQKTGLSFEVVVSTCCFASITGRWENAQAQMINAARSGLKYGATGYHISEWGDMGHAQQSSMPIAGYIYGATLAWGVANNQNIDVAYWLSKLHCQGNKQLADIILALQDVYLETGIDCPNCAFFGPLLFDQLSARHIKHATGLSEPGFSKTVEKLDKYISSLVPLSASYLQQQLLFSAQLLKHACLLGMELVKQNTREVPKLTRHSRTLLSQHLIPLISEYQRLWCIDHRTGGLSDSVGRLQYLQQLYDNLNSR